MSREQRRGKLEIGFDEKHDMYSVTSFRHIDLVDLLGVINVLADQQALLVRQLHTMLETEPPVCRAVSKLRKAKP